MSVNSEPGHKARKVAGADSSPFFISVVIVNYNGKELLGPCLSSLAGQTYEPFEVLVVDNASTDGSCAYVSHNFPRVRIVTSPTNVGFAAGNNLGVRAARGQLIATLNTDTLVNDRYLELLSAPIRENSASGGTIGACAPLMVEMDHPDRVDAAGIRVDAGGMAWNVGAGEPAARFDTQGEVFGACAGAALYRRAMLESVGGFDDSFFAFYEDVDLAWRARQAGWWTVFVPGARVLHKHGASFGKMTPYKTFLLARNRWRTLMKNSTRSWLWTHSPVIALTEAGSLVAAAGRGHLREAWAGRREAWRERARYIGKRG
jgi:GT2 family glycosyltransferase